MSDGWSTTDDFEGTVRALEDEGYIGDYYGTASRHTASIDLHCDRPGCDVYFSRLDGTDTRCPKCGLEDEVHIAESNYVWAKVASARDSIRAIAMQYVAHDSGDGETIYHCPFCGGGQVTGRSDGTVECGFCQNAFTVQIQPVHPGAPQTINGQPVEWPGQPEGTFQPDREVQPGAETGGMDQPDQAEAPPGQPSTEEPAQAPGGGPAPERKNPVPPQFANASFVTQAGHVLDTEAYMRHLAIRFADNPQDVLAEVRAERR